MSKSFVDANYRFIAAYQEVNARVTQRQQALALYVSLVVGLLAMLVALRPVPGQHEPPVEWLVLGFPVASLCLAFLNHKAERSITNLRMFLAQLEQLDDAHLRLPSYNTDPLWAAGANRARRWHDLAAAVLVVGGNAAGVGAALAIHPARFVDAPWAMPLTIVLALVSLAAVIATPHWHYTPPAKPN